MKKILLSLAFLVVSLFVLQAQDYTFRFGAKGGVSYTDLYASGRMNDLHTCHGYTIGGFAEVYRSDSTDLTGLFLRGGVSYSKRVVQYQAKDQTDNQHLEIPIQLGYKLKTFSFMKVYLLAGPYIDFRTYGYGYLRGDNSWKTQNISGGVQANLGFEFLKHYQIEAGYQFGLLPDYKGSKFSGKNRAFMATVGFAF